MNRTTRVTRDFLFPLNKPIKPPLAKVYGFLEQINQNDWYTNFGPMEELLTSRLKEFLGVKNLLLVSSGTVALQVASKVLGSSNLATSPFSFVATASSMTWQGHTINFADIDNKSLNLCPTRLTELLEREPSIDTILATHVYGNPCDVRAFEAISSHFDKKIIYDAAHAFNVKLANQSILEFGDASILSFHATKIFHTIEGGAIVFKEDHDYEAARQMINFGISKTRINEIGTNGKLSEYHAAVGLSILDEMEEVLAHRRMLYHRYTVRLKESFDLPLWHKEGSFNGAYMPVILKSDKTVVSAIEALTKKGIQSRRYFYPSLDNIFTSASPSRCTKSNDIAKRVICLPLHYYMSEKDVDLISDTLLRIETSHSM